MIRVHAVAAVFGLCSVLAAGAVAAEPVRENRVAFSVQAERQVPNDRVVAQLSVEREARDVGQLNDTLNALMADAVAAADAEESVDIQTNPANARPHYDPKSGKLLRWRASQTLVLTSEDFSATQLLMQVLQADFAIRQVSYSLQPATREDTEDELIREALLKAQGRAALIAGQMGMSGVRFINLTVNPANRQIHTSNRGVMMAAERSVAAAPSLEAGSSQVLVRIDVEVELLP